MNGPEWVLNPGPTDYQPSVLSIRPQRHDWKVCSFFIFLYLLHTNGSRSWEKMYISQTHFGFTNLGSQVHSFWVIAVSIRKFWSWTPCILEPFVGKVPHVFAVMVYPGIDDPLWIITVICSLLVASFELSKYLKDGPCQLFQTNGCFVLAMFNIMAIIWLQGLNLNKMFWIPIIALLLSLGYVSFCNYHILSSM